MAEETQEQYEERMAEIEDKARAENEGMQSKLGTNRVHGREDVDSAVPPRSGVGTSAAGVEATSPPVAEEPGENAYDDAGRADQAAATEEKDDVRPVTSGEKRVKYVGLAGQFNDTKSGKTFPKGKRVTVSGDHAARLVARKDFVSAD